MTESEALAYLTAKHPGKPWSIFAPLGIGLPCIDKVLLYVPCPVLDEASLDAVAEQVIAMVTPQRVA